MFPFASTRVSFLSPSDVELVIFFAVSGVFTLTLLSSPGFGGVQSVSSASNFSPLQKTGDAWRAELFGVLISARGSGDVSREVSSADLTGVVVSNEFSRDTSNDCLALFCTGVLCTAEAGGPAIPGSFLQADVSGVLL